MVARNVKKKRHPMVVKSMTAPSTLLFAVFEDGDEYEEFPVILFAVFQGDGDEDDVIGGLISAPDGLIVADLDEDFIGYRPADQEIDLFLEDHGRETGEEDVEDKGGDQ